MQKFSSKLQAHQHHPHEISRHKCALLQENFAPRPLKDDRGVALKILIADVPRSQQYVRGGTDRL